MKSINQVTLLGNLTRDPELRYTPSGTAVINFSIATNRSYKDKETDEWKEVADYHDVVFWAKSAEIIAQYLTKGKKVLVQGRLQTRSWETKEGRKRYKTEVVGRDFILLSPKDKIEKAPPPTNGDKDGVKKGKSEAEKKADEVFGDAKAEKKPEKHNGKEYVNPDEIPF